MRWRSPPGCRWLGCSAAQCARRRPTTATGWVCWNRRPPPTKHRNWSRKASVPSRCGLAARRGTRIWPPSGRCAAIPPDVLLMSDYNQALSPNTARERCRQLDDEGLYWIEEPVRHDDYAASAELAALLRTPVQIGENFAGPRAMSLALQHHASDLVMTDLERIGGVSGWLDAAALADAAGTEM